MDIPFSNAKSLRKRDLKYTMKIKGNADESGEDNIPNEFSKHKNIDALSENFNKTRDYKRTYERSTLDCDQ